ncbi:MAG: hypothetical protein NXI00_11090 [Cytophagales bacterium]|nr:hypothetical protein [Cytophagales bacterium]
MEQAIKKELQWPRYYVHKKTKQYIRLENEADGQIITMQDSVCGQPGKMCYRLFNYSLKSTDPETIRSLYEGENASYTETTKEAWTRATQQYQDWLKRYWKSLFKTSN